MALAAAQQRKVEEWCNEQGIETEADLAYMFTSHVEALREAGRAVADAWSSARVNVQKGLAVTIRQVVRSSEAVSPPVGTPRPSSSTRPPVRLVPAIKAKIAPSGYLKEASAESTPANYSHQLYAIVLACLDVPPKTDGERDLWNRWRPSRRRSPCRMPFALGLSCASFATNSACSGTREGFLWSVPRHTPQHLDLWPILETTLKEYGKMVNIPTKKLHWLAVDLDAGKPLGIAGFVQCMQLWMQHCIDRPSSLSSYSFRRVAPTWAALAALLEDQKLALGNWHRSLPLLPDTVLRNGAWRCNRS